MLRYKHLLLIYYQMDYKEKKNLYKCRKTVLEMLTDRKYDIPANFQISFEDFLLLLEENNLDIHMIKEGKPTVFVRFLYDFNKNLTKKDLDGFLEEIIEKTQDPNIHTILVLRNTPSKNNLEMLSKVENIEVFSLDSLTFNPVKHYLVPQHILLTEDEQQELFKKYRCTKAQLPKLNKNDRIARHYGMQSGDICKIIRKSPSMGESIYYRHVR